MGLARSRRNSEAGSEGKEPTSFRIKSGQRAPVDIQHSKISAIFVKLLNVLAQLKKQHKLASHIKHPQIPKFLSKSLAIYHINEKQILRQFNFTEDVTLGKKSDLVGVKSKRCIEVKATGRANFISLGRSNDMNADFLIWLVFDTDNARNFLKDYKIIIFPNAKRVFRGRSLKNLAGRPAETLERGSQGDYRPLSAFRGLTPTRVSENPPILSSQSKSSLREGWKPEGRRRFAAPFHDSPA